MESAINVISPIRMEGLLKSSQKNPKISRLALIMFMQKKVGRDPLGKTR